MMSDLSAIRFFELPTLYSTLTQDALAAIVSITQETTSLPNPYMLISYRVSYILKTNLAAGGERLKPYKWKKGRSTQSVYSFIVPKEIFTVTELEAKCRTHFINFIRNPLQTAYYEDNYSDVFAMWLRGKVLILYPNEPVVHLPRLRGVRLSQVFQLNYDTGAYDAGDSSARYVSEVNGKIQYGTIQCPFELSDNYLTLAMEAIVAPNTLRSYQPFFVNLKPSERIKP